MHYIHTGQTPQHLSNCVSMVSSSVNRYRLRSSDTADYVLPRTRTRYGDRGFQYSGPAAWNSLPADLHDITDTNTFKKRLKTVLFDCAYWRVITVVRCSWTVRALYCIALYSGRLQLLGWHSRPVFLQWTLDTYRDCRQHADCLLACFHWDQQWLTVVPRLSLIFRKIFGNIKFPGNSQPYLAVHVLQIQCTFTKNICRLSAIYHRLRMQCALCCEVLQYIYSLLAADSWLRAWRYN